MTPTEQLEAMNAAGVPCAVNIIPVSPESPREQFVATLLNREGGVICQMSHIDEQSAVDWLKKRAGKFYPSVTIS